MHSLGVVDAKLFLWRGGPGVPRNTVSYSMEILGFEFCNLWKSGGCKDTMDQEPITNSYAVLLSDGLSGS